jgi:hypothetical protein
MGYRWVVQPDGTFNDGLNVWDYVILKASDYDPGTKLVLGRPRLNKRSTIAVILVGDLKKKRMWKEYSSGGNNPLKEEIRFDTESLPFQAGDELEVLEHPSSSHVLS